MQSHNTGGIGGQAVLKDQDQRIAVVNNRVTIFYFISYCVG